jgi:hypothetical protein
MAWRPAPATELLSVLRPDLHVTIADVLERLIPQQGVSLLSNVDDIETHVRGIEDNFCIRILEAIDIL